MAANLEVVDFAVAPRTYRPEPCSDDEIAAIKHRQGLASLPTDYVGLMRRMGKGYGRYLRGSGFWYPRPLDLKRDFLQAWPPSVVQRLGRVTDLLVMFDHQDYIHHVIDIRDPDAIVMGIGPPGETVRELGPFRQWLIEQVEFEIAACREFKSRVSRRR